MNIQPDHLAADVSWPLSAIFVAAVLIASATSAHTVPDPWADNVISYNQGSNPQAGFTDPTTALGEPTRTTNITSPVGGAVTPFQPAFGTDEIVSIGAGGQLTVSFDEPITDDAGNPFGIDLLVFGNAFYVYNFSNQTATGATFTEGGVIEVSANGTDFVTVPDLFADDLFPTNGFLDPTRDLTTATLDGSLIAEGTVPTDFTLPVDPSLEVGFGDTLDDILEIYNGSGGGVGIDLADVGLSEVSFVRVSNPLGSTASPEIDGFADVVPEPTSLVFIAAGLAVVGRRRRAA
ncbi:MAG: PEP-CTERM sorting domain-containing protein [Planctomycetota bacterium]